MSKALSLGLRVRVLAAVAEGLSHRAAARRLGISAASVSWRRALLRHRADRRSGRIEAQRALILRLLEGTPDITIQK